MDQSRRAVESYWRTKMVDGVTADEDKVAPVYKLEEVCELLRTSPAGIVKEVSDYILKRLDHKSPIVKQKALRLVKYAVGKSGNEFRREMQRHSTVMRQLVHYKGQLDPLKGDALNKAVRDTAHEAIAAIFSTDDNKVVAPSNEGLGKRIQGFGNTNFEVVSEDKKSFLSEVVGLGSASIKQGLNTIASAHSSMKNDTGSYRSPTLRKSLTKQTDSRLEYESDDPHRGGWISSRTKATASGTWGPDSTPGIANEVPTNDVTSSNNLGIKSREERLLETIVTSGGVRLQPTRDALQAFLAEASKLDALSMSHALEVKLQSHLWQVRMKAVCVLEAILRKKDEEYFSIIASYFTDNSDSIVRCTELPQVSLREKATKVLCLLSDEEITGTRNAERSNTEANVAPVSQMPDLIDTGDLEDGGQDSIKTDNQSTVHQNKTGSLVDDLFGQDPLADVGTSDAKIENDPFADVSFHNSVENEQNDLFSGFAVENKPSNLQSNGKTAPDLFDVLSSNSEQLPRETGSNRMAVNDLMAGLTLNNASQSIQQPGSAGASSGDFSGVTFLNDNSQLSQMPTNGGPNGNLGLGGLYNQSSMQFNLPPNMIFNQGFPIQPIHYGSMEYLIAQQQLLLQNIGNFNTGYGQQAGNAMDSNTASPLPDIFQLSNNPVPNHASIANIPKKETKAFDFISDHLAAARDPKRVL